MYKRGKTFSIRVPLRTGGTRIIASGTNDKLTARAMQTMCRALAAQRDWTILETVSHTKHTRRRQALNQLFDAYRSNALDTFRTTLADVDLTDHLEAWRNTLRGRLSSGSRMVDRYVAVVRTLMLEGQPFPRSSLTPATISAWQASPPTDPSRAKSGQSMRIQRRLALSSFCAYLIEIGVLTINPVKQVKGAGKLKPKVVWLAVDDMMRLIDAFPEPYRTLSALLHGTGLEIGAALTLRKRDLIPARRAIRAPGTKTASRDRVARVRAFAWTYLERHVKTMLPAALLFDLPYERVRRQHVAAVKAAGIRTDYTLHSARHSFAVQLLQEGVPHALIAANLGHKDESEVVMTYGRYKVDVDQWTIWEKRIAQHAAAEKK